MSSSTPKPPPTTMPCYSMSAATTNTPLTSSPAQHMFRCINYPQTRTLPPGELWVHCASGYRASIAASLLDRAGRDVVFIDDSFDSAVEAGLTNQSVKSLPTHFSV